MKKIIKWIFIIGVGIWGLLLFYPTHEKKTVKTTKIYYKNKDYKTLKPRKRSIKSTPKTIKYYNINKELRDNSEKTDIILGVEKKRNIVEIHKITTIGIPIIEAYDVRDYKSYVIDSTGLHGKKRTKIGKLLQKSKKKIKIVAGVVAGVVVGILISK